MDTYNRQPQEVQDAIDAALDTLMLEMRELGLALNMSDPSAHAAEALAVYCDSATTIPGLPLR